MFSIIKEGSIEGNKVNEDKIFYKKNFVVFLDGASGLTKKVIPGSESDAYWYVNEFVKQLADINKNANYKYKRYELRKTISNIKKKYEDLLKKDEVNNLNTPSASGIVLYDDETSIKGYYFGDVLTVIKNKNNKYKEYYDKNLSNLDTSVFLEAKEISKKENIPFSEAIKKCQETILTNRNLKNTDKGYYIFGLDTSAVKKINTFKYDKKEIESILIMSDGFYSFFDNRNYDILFETINKNNPDELLKKIKSSFQEDVEFSKYNRFKLVDDISFLSLKTK